MKVRYFEDTDTLYIELSDREPAKTEDLNDNVMLELDKDGKVVGLTIEHAKEAKGKLEFSYETIAA
ncbi:MAG: DUF2283 domain-containing protein [Proteobacteria bacterium]|nr:DUF2283 domain-containing protein [Pseudomonadota bacterium]